MNVNLNGFYFFEFNPIIKNDFLSSITIALYTLNKVVLTNELDIIEHVKPVT